MVVTSLSDLTSRYNQCSKTRFRIGNIPLTDRNGFTSELNLSSAPYRKSSTSSTDSCDSDGQLCTEESCIMERKKNRQETFEISTPQKLIKTDRLRGATSCHVIQSKEHDSTPKGQNCNVPWNIQTHRKLCKSCGGEMQKMLAPEVQDGTKVHVRYRRMFKQMMARFIPCWLSEPEYLVHPKPKDRSDQLVVHGHADSLFSTSSGFTNYHGILNLCLIMLVLGHARLFLENIIRYGILINLSFTNWFLHEPYNWPNLLLTLSIVVYPAIALVTEKALAKKWISNKTGVIVYVVNLTVLLSLPATVIYVFHPIILFSLVTLVTVSTCFLKLVSYAHVNYWCRESMTSVRQHKRRSSSGSTSQGTKTQSYGRGDYKQTYPENLNVRDLTYFMFAPTLCYELNFPRSARIRKRFLAKRLIEMVFLSWLLVALTQQWIVPAVNNVNQLLTEMENLKLLESLLMMSISIHLIWMLLFYWYFHSCLNVIAELLRFADREFYRDWWNAETFFELWRRWNVPVHRFAVRHVYKPLLMRGVNKYLAATVVFLFSGFFHEYLMSVPLRIFKVQTFFGMLFQVPSAYICGLYIQGKWGNIMIWLSLILGQPMALLAYLQEYYIVHSLVLTPGNITES